MFGYTCKWEFYTYIYSGTFNLYALLYTSDSLSVQYCVLGASNPFIKVDIMIGVSPIVSC